VADSVSVPLSSGQIAHFRDLDRREESARLVAAERSAAALAIVLGQYSAQQVNGQRLHIDLEASVVTFTPKDEG
jgi:hypothetical protein